MPCKAVAQSAQVLQACHACHGSDSGSHMPYCELRRAREEGWEGELRRRAEKEG